MDDQQFWNRWDQIYADNQKKKLIPKPKKMDPWQGLIRQIDVLVPMMIGFETNPKLGSQQQMKVRKSIDDFCSKMVVLTDPEINEQLANEIYYESLKQKMMDKMKDE